MESPSGNVGLDLIAYLLTTELFEHANPIVACPITRAAHWRTSACMDANDHLESVRKPIFWASQVEIQAAVYLYGVPIYLFTPNASGPGYHWQCYSKRTFAVPELRHHHIELAHQSSVHFDCIVDATIMRSCTVPPRLSPRICNTVITIQ